MTSGDTRPPFGGVKVGGTCDVLWFTRARSKIGVPHRIRNGRPKLGFHKAPIACAVVGNLSATRFVGIPVQLFWAGTNTHDHTVAAPEEMQRGPMTNIQWFVLERAGANWVKMDVLSNFADIDLRVLDKQCLAPALEYIAAEIMAVVV